MQWASRLTLAVVDSTTVDELMSRAAGDYTADGLAGLAQLPAPSGDLSSRGASIELPGPP